MWLLADGPVPFSDGVCAFLENGLGLSFTNLPVFITSFFISDWTTLVRSRDFLLELAQEAVTIVTTRVQE